MTKFNSLWLNKVPLCINTTLVENILNRIIIFDISHAKNNDIVKIMLRGKIIALKYLHWKRLKTTTHQKKVENRSKSNVNVRINEEMLKAHKKCKANIL
jgi:hypothetical protein